MLTALIIISDILVIIKNLLTLELTVTMQHVAYLHLCKTCDNNYIPVERKQIEILQNSYRCDHNI